MLIRRLEDAKAANNQHTSVFKSKATMIVGQQDERKFVQYLLGAKTWTGPKDLRRRVLLKSEENGYILSAFAVSREFGFGRMLMNDELAKIISRLQRVYL